MVLSSRKVRNCLHPSCRLLLSWEPLLPPHLLENWAQEQLMTEPRAAVVTAYAGWTQSSRQSLTQA